MRHSLATRSQSAQSHSFAMSGLSTSPYKNLPIAIAVSLGVTSIWFWLTWRYGFDLADEGFYWYGAQRVMRGEVPMRDFMSYDIGRYYWAASWMYVLGDDGIFGARLSAAIYQAFGTSLGVYVCLLSFQQRGVLRWLVTLLIACTLTVWVWPYYKVYDHATSILIVAILVLILRSTRPATWFAAGVCLGVAAMMGRNHGVYGAFSVALVVSVLMIKGPSRLDIVKRAACFALGVIVGFAPTLGMMWGVEGFAGAFIESILALFRSGSTNIGLPVIWPWSWSWSESLSKNGYLTTSLQLSKSMGFLFLVVYPMVGLVVLAYRRFNMAHNAAAVTFATVAAAIPYMHYSFSRADITHLTLGIFPALIGILAAAMCMRGLQTAIMALFIFAGSLLTLSTSQPVLALHLMRMPLVQAEITGQKIWIDDGEFGRLRFAMQAISALPDGKSQFLALPNLMGLYAIYRVKSPLWEIYALPAIEAESEIRQIVTLESNPPNLIILSDHALDKKPEFRYSQIRPLVFAWLTSKYQVSGIDDPNRNGNDLRTYSIK